MYFFVSQIQMNTNKQCTELCTQTITAEQAKLIARRIKDEYYIHMWVVYAVVVLTDVNFDCIKLFLTNL